jgi:RNA polymerase sigma factor (sigma-70 family)
MRNEELLALARAGDAEAYQRLYENNTKLIWRVIHTFSPSQRDMDDFYSVACIGFMKACIHYQVGKSKFSTYLYKCVQSEIHHYLRKLKYRRHEVPMLGMPEKATNTENMSNFHQIVGEFIASLGEVDKQIFVKRYLIGQSQAYVARSLGISQTTVWRREKAIIQKLGQKVREVEGDETTV